MKLALHLAHLPIAEKVKLTRSVVTAMTGNAVYPTPAIALAAMTTSANDLEAKATKAKAMHEAWLTAVADQHAAEKALDESLTHQAHYVEHASGGDEPKLHSSGFSVAHPPVHAQSSTLVAPTALAAVHGDHDFEAHIHFHKVAGAGSYLIQTADASSGPWAITASSTRSRATLTGITKPTWIRVAAFDSHGTGPWSDPIRYAPPA